MPGLYVQMHAADQVNQLLTQCPILKFTFDRKRRHERKRLPRPAYLTETRPPLGLRCF
jgi:hypothetical protein